MSKLILYRLIGLCLLIVFGLNVQAQYPSMVEAEYSIDGVSALSMTASDGSFGELWEEIEAELSSLSQGTHTISIRMKDASGNWSEPISTVISVESPITARSTSLTMAEIQIDSNTPQAVLVVDGNWDEVFEQVDLSGLTASAGLHTLNLRVMGQDGSWSEVFSTTLSVEEALTARTINITEAEFRLNGGSPTAMLVVDGNWDEAFEAVNLSGIVAPATGTHILSLRVRGTDGIWSNYFNTVIKSETPITSRTIGITQAECWVDNSPAQSMLVFDGNWDEAFENVLINDLASPAEGLHHLSMRVQGQDGVWSNVFETVISVESPITSRETMITEAEYWFNSEAHQPLIVFDGNWDEAFEAVLGNGLNAPGSGLQTLNIRVKGMDGNWSNTVTSVISVEAPIEARISELETFEVYFDNNPGLALTLIAQDGNVNKVFEEALGDINPAILGAPGLHTIHLRTRGVDGQWSDDFTSVVFVDACLTNPTVQVSPAGPLDLCPNDSLELTATAGLESYSWYRGAEEIAQTPSIWVNEPGYYYVIGYDTEGCPGASNGVWVNAVSTPELVVNANGPAAFCEGNDVTLTASGAFVDFNWSTSENGASITIDTAGDYFVEGTTSSGCTVLSPVISVEVYDNPITPVITPSGSLFICQEDSVLLTSDISEGIEWSTGQTTASIWASSAGEYSVTLTDNQVCSATSASVTVSQSQVSAQISPVDQVDICDGQDLNIIAQDGPGFEFQWLDNGIAIPGASGQTLNVNSAGLFSVIVSDGSGCVDTSQTVSTSIIPTPDATISANGPLAFCVGGSVELSVNDGDSWLWNNGATTSSIIVETGGDYQVSVTGSNGCVAVSDLVTVDVGEPLQALQADPPIVWFPNTDVNFTATTQGTIVSYDWSFGDGASSTDPAPTHSYTASGFYDVSLTVVDDAGCSSTLTGTQLVEVWEIFENDSLGIGDPGTITGISFINTLIGCVTLSDGTVLATTDGGITWVDVTGTINANNLNDILLTGVIDDTIAIVVGDDGVAAVSVNDGPWVTPATGTNEDLTDIVPGPPGIYYATGDNGTVLCYDNGVWTDISFPGGSGINFGAAYWYGGVLWVMGSNGSLYSWGGGSWSTGLSGFGGGGSGTGGGAFGFGGGGSGIGVFGAGGGTGGGIWTTSDGGGTWTQTWPGNGYGINTVTVVNENLIICSGDHGMVLVSTDGGQTWEVLSVGNTEDITDSEAEGCVGYLTGADGSVYTFDIPNYQAGAPSVFVSPALEVCSSEPVILQVLDARPGNTYVWSTGETGLQISVTESGTYFVTMTEFCDTASSVPLDIIINETDYWYPDNDGDGFGDVNLPLSSCEQPGPEYVLDGRDCFDDDPNLVLCCPGDFNEDGIINTGDLTALLGQFGTTCGSPFCGGDINGDGITNTADLTALLGVFGDSCD